MQMPVSQSRKSSLRTAGDQDVASLADELDGESRRLGGVRV
jgi:hypothetical protein